LYEKIQSNINNLKTNKQLFLISVFLIINKAFSIWHYSKSYIKIVELTYLFFFLLLLIEVLIKLEYNSKSVIIIN